MNGLADLIRALGALRADSPEERAEIARLLGLGAAPAPSPEVVPSPTEPAIQSLQKPLSPAPAAPAPAATTSGQALSEEMSLEVHELPRTTTSGSLPEWLRRPLPALAAPDAAAVPPPFQPLFAPAWTRSLLSTAVSTEAPGGPIDVDRLVDRVARLLPITRVPRLPAPTLALGVQALIESGPRLGPFAADAEHLVARLQSVAGLTHTQLLRFADSPLTVQDADGEWGDYRPPRPGTPVLAFTDLGIAPYDAGERDLTADWLDLAAALEGGGCRLIALCPYPPRRWPKRLSAAMTVIEWDRPTRAGTVRSALLRRRAPR